MLNRTEIFCEQNQILGVNLRDSLSNPLNAESTHNMAVTSNFNVMHINEDGESIIFDSVIIGNLTGNLLHYPYGDNINLPLSKIEVLKQRKEFAENNSLFELSESIISVDDFEIEFAKKNHLFHREHAYRNKSGIIVSRYNLSSLICVIACYHQCEAIIPVHQFDSCLFFGVNGNEAAYIND